MHKHSNTSGASTGPSTVHGPASTSSYRRSTVDNQQSFSLSISLVSLSLSELAPGLGLGLGRPRGRSGRTKASEKPQQGAQEGTGPWPRAKKGRKEQRTSEPANLRRRSSLRFRPQDAEEGPTPHLLCRNYGSISYSHPHLGRVHWQLTTDN